MDIQRRTQSSAFSRKRRVRSFSLNPWSGWITWRFVMPEPWSLLIESTGMCHCRGCLRGQGQADRQFRLSSRPYVRIGHHRDHLPVVCLGRLFFRRFLFRGFYLGRSLSWGLPLSSQLPGEGPLWQRVSSVFSSPRPWRSPSPEWAEEVPWPSISFSLLFDVFSLLSLDLFHVSA